MGVFSIVATIVLVIIILQLLHKREVKTTSTAVQSGLSTTQQTFSSENFTPTSEYSLASYLPGAVSSTNIVTFKFYVDTVSERIAFSYLRQGRIDFIDFEKIIGYDVIVDGQTMSSNSIGGGAIGNNGIGIGLSHSVTKSNIQGISFKINLNNTNSPNYIVPLVANEKIDTTSQFYKEVNLFIEQMKSVLDTIIRNNNYNSTANKTTIADDLKDYKDLYDSGVITQEEFEAMKKQLLGL